MNFVGGVSIPDNELSVLGRRYKVAFVDGPMQSIYLSEMALERTTDLHSNSWHSLDILRHSLDLH